MTASDAGARDAPADTPSTDVSVTDTETVPNDVTPEAGVNDILATPAAPWVLKLAMLMVTVGVPDKFNELIVEPLSAVTLPEIFTFWIKVAPLMAVV